MNLERYMIYGKGIERIYIYYREHRVRFMAILRFLRRNLVSITFPTLTATFIWLDWNHTRHWKALSKKQ
ncbi:unnamed protein product [Pieris brassicae]|uniref:Uncharacterized protein n=1 Tax=Pieris brassicae TaxID=7116 RepID=A0A9P0U129_PIEBR|nr:unnamed protein product [Pieris brassicae]